MRKRELLTYTWRRAHCQHMAPRLSYSPYRWLIVWILTTDPRLICAILHAGMNCEGKEKEYVVEMSVGVIG